jgi:SAM-dependent methyltransferase
MTWSYDRVAERYDEHFNRPVDRWEDARLGRFLRPLVNGARVLDLGCGTGYLLDLARPASYTGVDASAAMLARLRAKHPGARLVKADIGADGWADELPTGAYDVITATWAAQYFGDLGALLWAARVLARPGATIALHGYLPRYAARAHEITGDQAVPVIRPQDAAGASEAGGLGRPRIRGTGALPDSLARSRLAWRAAAALVPARWHYAALWTWRVPT